MLLAILQVGLLALSAIILIPTLTLFCEVAASLFKRDEKFIELEPLSRVAVLLPAHNESVGLVPTLSDVRAQLSSQDRLLVIADNCDDDTATVARDAGAEVIERHDLQRVGKGYALHFGVQHLREDPPDVVMIVDADCRVAPGSVDMLSHTARFAHRPAQALYLMTAPQPASVTERASEFAWRIKNQTRPLGLHVLGLPCQLMGSGMAFPWQLISRANLATGHIVEDLNLGIELAALGHPPVFCPKARVTSTFPTSAKAAENQRYRWEHGHVRVLTSAGPRLALLALRRGDIGALALALDLLVPPLGLLGFLNLSMLVLSGGLWLTGAGSYAFAVALISLTLIFASVAIAWWSNGRDLLAASDLPLALGYLASKIGLYRKLFSGRGVASWVRTDRGDR